MKPNANPEGWRIHLQGIENRLLQNWPYFVTSLSLALLIGLLYLAWAPPIYETSLQLLATETTAVSSANPTAATAKEPPSAQSRMSFLKSRGTIRNTLHYLDFQVSFYEDRFWGQQEIMAPMPLQIRLDEEHPQLLETNIVLEIFSVDSFLLWVDADPGMLIIPAQDRQQKISQAVRFSLKGAFGQFVEHDFLRLMVLTDAIPPSTTQEAPVSIRFQIHDLATLSNAYAQRLEMRILDPAGSLLELSMEGPMPEKDRIFLNGLAHQYLNYQVEEKKHISQGTIDFIEAQLSEISDSLAGNAAQMNSVRRGRAAQELRMTSASVIPQLRQFQAQRSDLESRLAYYDELTQMLELNNDPSQLVSPSNRGIDEPLLAESITEIKRQYAEKVIKSVSADENSLDMQSLNRQIDRTRKQLLLSVQTIRTATEEALSGVRQRIGQMSEVVRNLPGNEQFLDRMERKFEFNDDLYNYLLKRRMEAEMALLEVQADSKIVEPAHQVGEGPVAPKRVLVILLLLLLGFLLPFFLILGKSLTEGTILESGQIEKRVKAPILGHILTAPQKAQEGNLWANETTLAVAENFRYLFVNLEVMPLDKPSKVITVTSTVPNEGKTFCAVNLAQIMAAAGKRVLLIGADIRKPRMHKQLLVPNRIGLTDYLSHQAPLASVIQDTSLSSLKCITSGPVALNAAELLDGQALPLLISQLEADFDYIIIDTPPAGLFADFLQISRYADFHLYVIRQRHSRLDFLKDIEQLRQHTNLKRFFLLFNDVKYGNGYRTKYGYDYGYGDKGAKSIPVAKFNGAVPLNGVSFKETQQA